MTITAINTVRGTSTRSGKIKVLIVDDSLVLRHLIAQALKEDPDFEIVGAEADGAAALERIPLLSPDVVTLDIEMPGMNGLDTLRQIRKLHPRLRTVMFSTLTTRGGAATFEALSLGADDYVAKPSNSGSLDRSMAALRSELVPKLKQFFTKPGTSISAANPPPARTVAKRPAKVSVVGVGVSTGGPEALCRLIPLLPGKLGVPVLIVQHMPAMFTKLLAERLNATSAIEVLEAEQGMEVKAGRVIVARGDHHMRVARVGSSVTLVLDQGPQVNYCRPAVDVLFTSLAEVYRNEVLSVVLTGMGNDGLRGTEVLKSAGSYSLVQDQASSVVWGMPGAIAQAGFADQVLPLAMIAPEIEKLVKG